MGLSIQPGGANWPYSSFNAFRRRLARAEGIDLAEMSGYGGDKSWDLPNGQSITTLTPLLLHSDCDGHINSWDCASVLPRLAAIVAEWPHDDYDRQQAELLIDGLRHCAEHRCALTFQ